MDYISSVNNNLIKETILLKETKNIKKTNKYLIEGLNMVNLAIKKKLVTTVFVLNDFKKDLLEHSNTIFITDNVAKKLSDLKTPQGVFAICTINQPSFDESNYLILDDIQDPGNLGTLLRSAYAFGFNNIICSPNSVSFYNSKVLRATQANHFELNLFTTDLVQFLDKLKQKKYTIVGTNLHSNKLVDFKDLESKKIALVLGNEGNGISKQVLEVIDSNLILKTNPDVESLNVAIAGSIIMHHFNK